MVKPGNPDNRPSEPDAEGEERWILRLYVAGQTPKCLTAFANLKQLCEEHLAGRYTIEVIDLIKNPQLGAGDQIFAIPTLVRHPPDQAGGSGCFTRSAGSRACLKRWLRQVHGDLNTGDARLEDIFGQPRPRRRAPAASPACYRGVG